jgi:HrpA-like RNA helicase
MSKVKDHIVAALAASDVVVVSGETGSGKTTQVMRGARGRGG